jgi:acyl-coenzyme A synthetase/AMP-(fatty) acid ligase
MSSAQFLLDRLRMAPDRTAIIWRGRDYDGGWVVQEVERIRNLLTAQGIGAGSVVVLRGDYSPSTAACLLALVDLDAIVAPLLPATLEKAPSLVDIVNPAFLVDAAPEGTITVESRPQAPLHELVRAFEEGGVPGLILFTSGSSGRPKGVVHDFRRLLVKFHEPRPALRTLNFLLFDHWGGLNTLLHCLASGSPVVLPENRAPHYICELLERHAVELLPASPTFLNLLLLSKAYEGRDFSHLRLITYGSEPMPAATLAGLRAVFPGVELKQTYGLIELGVLRAKSLSSDSLWVKVGGSGYDLRVVDGILQIKADSAMLGYLNAPSPFTEDGYFITGDRVELSGDYMRFLGRESEIINVGGQKVFPAEVETVLLECGLVRDAAVHGERHPITGSIVVAMVELREPSDEAEARRVIKRFCAERLEAFKVPVKIRFVEEGVQGDRLKRVRLWENSAGS